MELSGREKLDFVGDIHANSRKLLILLEKLGYINTEIGWKHPDNRQLVVLGDFINVGSDNRQTLEILYKMWMNKSAYIILGNHEYFLAWYFFKHGSSAFTSPKSPLLPDYETLLVEFSKNIDELCVYAEWLMCLPLYIKNVKFRAVHACWSEENIEQLAKYKNLNELFLSFNGEKPKKEKKLKRAINETVEGKKLSLYINGKIEKPVKLRVKWWQNIYNKPLTQSILTNKPVKYPDVTVTPEIFPDFKSYEETERPIFFGHYWFQSLPYLLRNNACCLDFGAAKGGYLSAYRWDGEMQLDAGKILYV